MCVQFPISVYKTWSINLKCNFSLKNLSHLWPVLSNSIHCNKNCRENWGGGKRKFRSVTQDKAEITSILVEIESTSLVFSKELVIAPDITTGGSAASWFNGGLKLHSWCWDWIRDLLIWVNNASSSVNWVNHLVESAFLASTILVQNLIRLAFWSVTASLILANSTVEWAVLAGTVLQDPLSEVTSVRATFSSVTLSSSVNWAISTLSTSSQSLSVGTAMWYTSLSIVGGSGVWVTRSASSVNLENFSGSAWCISTSLTFIECSGKVFAVCTGTIFIELLSLCADVWSALSAISLRSGVQFTILTETCVKESLSIVALVSQAFSASFYLSTFVRVHEWWAVFLSSVN